ncbi:MAG: hypothetical protein EOP09_07945 [Proteobacteria bacterium]|nr:MAG: hypothetical protein EOP09_07945 [Pseudomonadota bacterium]
MFYYIPKHTDKSCIIILSMVNSVESSVPRKNEGRVKVTHTLGADTVKMIEDYSERTKVPMGRVIDLAIEEFMKDKPEGKE